MQNNRSKRNPSARVSEIAGLNTRADRGNNVAKYILGLVTGIVICNWDTVFPYIQKLFPHVQKLLEELR